MKINIFVLLYCYYDGDGWYTERYIDFFKDNYHALIRANNIKEDKTRLYNINDKYPDVDENNPIEGYYKIIQKKLDIDL